MSNNHVELTGNLTKDWELRFTTAGTPVANGRIGVTERFQQDGEWKQRSTFVNLVVWGELAENVAESTEKGSRITVKGRLNTRSYDSNGETRYVTEVVCNDVGASLRYASAIVEERVREDEMAGAPADRVDPVYGDTAPI
jgi:single-strand DNA-binding protein